MNIVCDVLKEITSLSMVSSLHLKLLYCRLCHVMASADAATVHVSSVDAHSRNVHNGSVFHEYPPSRPFIHDDYRRDVAKPIIAYPESNRQGMI